MIGLKVEGLRRDEKGQYLATVVNGDTRVAVNRRHGSWQTDTRREVRPGVAAMLQDHVRRLEKSEARAEPVAA